jgi:tape measure domain-containing protein
MEFDNAAFERKIATTLASLEKLDKALKFEGATKGLNDVSAAAQGFHLGGMGSAIEGVSKGFLTLATIGITALSNLVSAAMHAGAQIAKGLLEPIKDGFQEYETNLNSIQTILANTAAKGTTMDQVTASLDKLNEYSDKTIYNFGQMAKNIGTFTAAGVELEPSVNAIKGIANLAAMSGSTSEQASSAMYQMSQAMASGSLKAQDWISVVNAGIGGQAFQSALYESAKALGTLKDVPVDQTF